MQNTRNRKVHAFAVALAVAVFFIVLAVKGNKAEPAHVPPPVYPSSTVSNGLTDGSSDVNRDTDGVLEEDEVGWDADTMGNGQYDPKVWDCHTQGDKVCQQSK